MRLPAPSTGRRRQSEVVMIEVFLFLAMFMVQILVMSVLYPLRFSRLVRAGLRSIPADRLAEYYPGVDLARAHERFLVRYRAANTLVAVLGLLLLGWFFSYMKRSDWDAGRVGALLAAYFLAQNLPVILIAWFMTRFNKVHRRSLSQTRRTAILQRRGLFDFVSPLAVVLAVLSYLSFAAFMFYVARNPFPGFGGPLLNIGILTLGIVLLGFVVYRVVYGRRKDLLQTHTDRMRSMRMVVQAYVGVCIFMPLIGVLTVARQFLELQAWGPFSGSLAFLILGLLSFRSITAPRQPEADGPGSSPVHAGALKK
jgi:hypothetical protein